MLYNSAKGLDVPFEEEISGRIGSRVIKGSLSKKSFDQKYGSD